MFIKYATNDVSDSYLYMNNMFDDIQRSISNTYTSTSDFNTTVCDVNNSLFYGSANSDLYSVIYNGAASDTSDGYLHITKKHHMSNTTYNFTRNLQFRFTNQGTYGFRGRFYDGDTYFPYNNSTQGYTHNTSAGNIYDIDMSKGHEINLYLSDYWIIFQIHWGSEMATYALMDYEITPMDYYMYDNASLGAKNYFPGINLSSFVADSFNEDLVGANQGQNCFNLGLQGYLTNSGAVFDFTDDENTISYAIHNNVSSDENIMPIIYPNGWRNVHEMQILGGSVHPMIPVSFHGHGNHSTDSPVISSKIPYFYRTTDDIGYPGQQITYNGTDYMNLMLHKNGGVTVSDADNFKNACYLVPKLIGGR